MDFPEVDSGTMAQELRLEEKAATNGSHELPGSDTAELDGPQREVKQRIEFRIRKVVAGYKKRLDGLTNEIRSYDIQSLVDRIKSAHRSFEHDLLDLNNEFKSAIKEARGNLLSAQAEFNKFKSKYNIDRDPEYPDSRWFQVGLILIAGVLEAAVNSYFFYQGLEEGIVGGAFIALVLASVDVVAVCMLGYRAVWVIHGKEIYHRLAGFAASLAFITWALFYNLLATHVREDLQGDVVMSTALEQAWDSFLANPFAITQADSIILLFSGIVFSTMAFFSGTIWEEKIPGYGKLHRRLVGCREELEFWIDEYRQNAADLRDEATRDLDDTMREARGKVTTLENLIQTKDTLLTTVSQCIYHHREACQALMQLYRDANMRARSTPPPDYFDEPIQVKLIEAPDYDTVEDYDHLREQKEKLDPAQEAVEEVRANIRSVYKEHLAQVSRLDGHERIISENSEESQGQEVIH